MDERTRALRERLMRFSLRCLKLFRALPRVDEARVYGRQLLRSSSSVGANHREACRSRSKVEFRAKLGDSLKEMDETCYWLELIRKAELMDPDKMADLEKEADQLTGILVTILKNSKL
ncbi:four helix bundle protein [Haloferula sp. A504]|uniref:four helix bundle protein n=1 Tax=Haloferula sp. A504 TaxID=3373601 RepID=UPI0031C11DB9|nr:four helix bundle protein [Verrucomicrobiaceae bacterium E54]